MVLMRLCLGRSGSAEFSGIAAESMIAMAVSGNSPAKIFALRLSGVNFFVTGATIPVRLDLASGVST